MAIRFSVESGGITRTYAFRKDVVTVGRSKNCTVPIDDPALSRTHCQFEVEPGGHLVRDLNSRNGTELNGERISRQTIGPGDEVVIGKAIITFLGSDIRTASTHEEAQKTAHLTANLFGIGRRKRRRPKDLERDLKRLQQTLAINRRLASELEPERVLPMILDEAIDLVDAERGFLLSVDDDGIDVPVARDFWRKDIAEATFEVSRSIAEEVMRRGEPVLTEDASEDVRFKEMVSVFNLKIRSVICVPLKIRGKVVGALYLDSRVQRATFSTADVEVLAAFADQAAISLQNSGRYERTREMGTKWKRRAKGRERELVRVRAEIRQLEIDGGMQHDFTAAVGRSPAMRECLRLVDRVVDVDLPVLIRGESGTGKERLARMIHENGPRAAREFVTVDPASFPSGLIEAELFGAAKGAFSGATEARAGLIERAGGGTLFLDSVGDMTPELQTRLLRVLESGQVRRLGETDPRRVDVRVVSATRDDLEGLIAAGQFREDLYYRLKGLEVDVPPLRERPDDIPPLIQTLLASFGADIEISPRALARLCAYPWPGNVRELSNELQRLQLVVDGGIITPRDLSRRIAESGKIDSSMGDLKTQVERLERALIKKTLTSTDGNKTRAAELLGLSRLGLRKKMERYDITG